jgi:hypothetical protein
MLLCLSGPSALVDMHENVHKQGHHPTGWLRGSHFRVQTIGTRGWQSRILRKCSDRLGHAGRNHCCYQRKKCSL